MTHDEIDEAAKTIAKHCGRNAANWSDYRAFAHAIALENERLRATNHLDIVLPPFGHAFTLPTQRLDMEALKWMQDNCVIVTRAEWDRLTAADQPDDALARFASDLAAAQKPLDQDAAKVLYENLSDLYVDGSAADNGTAAK